MFHRNTSLSFNQPLGRTKPFDIENSQNGVSIVPSKTQQPRARSALGDISNAAAAVPAHKPTSSSLTTSKPSFTSIYADATVQPATRPSAFASTSVPSALGQHSTSISSRISVGDIPSIPSIDIDSADSGNPQACVEYVNDIYEYFREKEVREQVSCTYMSSQPELQEKMRAVLLDWLVDVHLKYRLQPETYFLTVQLIDRYLSLKPVARSKLQLIGVTAMLIASKYEEMYTPDVRDFVRITDQSYSETEIMNCEIQMLNCLEFNLSAPTALQFVNRFSKAALADPVTSNTAVFLCELSTLDYKMLKYLPSQIAAAAILLAQKMNRSHASWTSTLQYYTNYAEKSLQNCVSDLASLRAKADTATFMKAIMRKYGTSKYLEVSKIPLPASV